MINYSKNLTSAGTAIIGISLIVYSLFRETELETNSFILLFSGIILCGLGLYWWLKKESISTYNDKAQRLIISRKDEKIEELNETRLELEKAIHTDGKKLPAYREAIKSFIVHIENPAEKKRATELYKALRTAYAELAWETADEPLPPTEMPLLDTIFQYYRNVAMRNNIAFTLNIDEDEDCDIGNITQSIPQSQLETLVSNLLDNAIKAIAKSDDDSDKRITARLWSTADGCGLSVEDNGTAFNDRVLADLERCKEELTPNRRNGVGLGFVTIFKIANECKASVEVVESNGFKSITVRFDGRNRIINNNKTEILQ